MTGRRGYQLVLLAVCVTLTGCTHFHEDRAITAFTEALSAGDVQELRAVTSSDFGEKALRRAEAMDDLEILGLPDEKPTIVEVEDVSKWEKQVTVTTGEGETELLYKLTRPEKGAWVVDDVFTRQQRGDVSVSKPITEQMDLLLTIREFLDAWGSDDRNRVLAITTPDFNETLAKLPAPWLARVAQQVVDNSEREKSRRNHKPKVAIDGHEAVVQLPRTDGTLKLLLERDAVSWKVNDIAIQTRRKETLVGSIKNNARIMAAGTQFAEAFSAKNKQSLQSLSTSAFYNDALRGADLSIAPLPDIALAATDFEVKATASHASLLVPTPSQAVRMEFQRLEEPGKPDSVRYKVKEVQLYDQKGENQIRLSSLFTAERRVREFHAALAAGQLDRLKTLSSADLGKQVWARAKGMPVQLLPIGVTSGGIRQRKDTEFRGSLTHVTMLHAHGPATYVLTDAGKQLVVDDILVQRDGKPVSLKRDLMLAVPILKFAGAFETNQVEELQRVCSNDFGRRVWDRTKTVPPTKTPVMANLTRPISALAARSGRARVELGTARSGAIVDLVKENQFWVVDDVEIFTGVAPSQHVQLKSSMSEAIAAARQNKAMNRVVGATAPPEARKRFDLRRKDKAAEPSRRLALAPVPPSAAPLQEPTKSSTIASAAVPDASDWEPMPVPSTPKAAQPASPQPKAAIQQVAGTLDGDGGVQHAMMFAPLDTPHTAELATSSPPTAPAILNAPDVVAQMPAPKPQATPDAQQVDLDALFSDFSDTPNDRKPEATQAQVKVTTPLPQPAPEKAIVPVVSSVPPHDAGRVTDPALQPIRIPRN